jgi:hypothetical protein
MKYRILVAVLLSHQRFVEILYGKATKEDDRKVANQKAAILGPSFQPKEGECFYLFGHFLEDQQKIFDKINLGKSRKADSKLPFNVALKKQDAVRGAQKAIKADAMESKTSISPPDPLAGVRHLLKLPPKPTTKLTVAEILMEDRKRLLTKLLTKKETEEIDAPMEDPEDTDVDGRKPAAKTGLDKKKPVAKRDGQRQSLPIQPAKVMHPPILGSAAVAAQKQLSLLLSGKKLSPSLEAEEDTQSLEEVSDVTNDELNEFVGKQYG